MAQLKLGAIKDLGGIGGFTFTSSGVTANGTLTVTDIVIDGNISGSSNYILPNPSGQSGNFVTNNGSSMSWGAVNLRLVFALCKCGHPMAHGIDQVV